MKFIVMLSFVGFLAGCERADRTEPPAAPPLAPCTGPAWTRVPTEAEFVSAVVGPGGTEAERDELRALVTDIWVPLALHHPSVDRLNAVVSSCFDMYDPRVGGMRAAAVVVVDGAAWMMIMELKDLAQHRVELVFEPDKPRRPWDPILDWSIADVEGRAAVLDALLDDLRRRTERYFPPLFGDEPLHVDSFGSLANHEVRIARDLLGIALGRSYARGSWGIDNFLRDHGIPTMPTPDEIWPHRDPWGNRR